MIKYDDFAWSPPIAIADLSEARKKFNEIGETFECTNFVNCLRANLVDDVGNIIFSKKILAYKHPR